MAWKIEFLPAADKELGKLPKSVRRSIIEYLEDVRALGNPTLRGKPLRGDKSGLWRYRVEKYRIICRIEKERLVVLYIHIAKRDKVYE